MTARGLREELENRPRGVDNGADRALHFPRRGAPHVLAQRRTDHAARRYLRDLSRRRWDGCCRWRQQLHGEQQRTHAG